MYKILNDIKDLKRRYFIDASTYWGAQCGYLQQEKLVKRSANINI